MRTILPSGGVVACNGASRYEQKAQLSQRDRATLRVIQYFAESLNVTQVIRNDTPMRVCKSILVFHWNYVCMSHSFWDVQRQRTSWPRNRGRGRSRSLKMVLFDRSHTTFYWSAAVSITLSCTVLSYLTLNNIVTLKSGLEVTQYHSNWYNSKARLRFPICLYDRIFNRLWDIWCQRIALPWKLG